MLFKHLGSLENRCLCINCYRLCKIQSQMHFLFLNDGLMRVIGYCLCILACSWQRMEDELHREQLRDFWCYFSLAKTVRDVGPFKWLEEPAPR